MDKRIYGNPEASEEETEIHWGDIVIKSCLRMLQRQNQRQNVVRGVARAAAPLCSGG